MNEISVQDSEEAAGNDERRRLRVYGAGFGEESSLLVDSADVLPEVWRRKSVAPHRAFSDFAARTRQGCGPWRSRSHARIDRSSATRNPVKNNAQ